jgi:hypothetical protein
MVAGVEQEAQEAEVVVIHLVVIAKDLSTVMTFIL